MPNAFETGVQGPVRSPIAGHVIFEGVFPIATGGLPINPIGTGIPTGTLPIPTGSINGVPSGVPLYYKGAGGMRLSRIAAGSYRLNFAPAPNGTVKAWMELSTVAARTFFNTKRDIATGYVEFSTMSASGTAMDPANGDAIGVEYTAFSTGDPGAP